MRPFFISSAASNLMPLYIDLNKLIDVVRNDNEEELYGLCRLWMSEGTPYMFAKQPMMYEIVRGWLSRRLDIHPKEITLIGSARVGYSLNPRQIGKSFGVHSDLDLVVISMDLFSRFEVEYANFAKDLKGGFFKAQNPRKEKLYYEIADDLERTRLNRGFLDTWKLPTIERYPLAKHIVQTCWMLCKKLEVSDDNFIVKKSSIRVYKNFESFVRQTRINLKYMLSCHTTAAAQVNSKPTQPEFG